MGMLRQILILIMAGSLIFWAQSSFAVSSLEVSTSKKVYEYGDFLSINFQVPRLVNNTITIHITDSANKTSTPINLPITKLNSTIVSPVPFYKINFNPGTYRIDAQYSNMTASTSFDLVDSGKIVIPTEFKSLIQTMAKGSPDNKAYAGIIRELINDNILSVAGDGNQTGQIHIPRWFKNNFDWWANGSISDNEFGTAIEYLIQEGVMHV